MNVVLWIVAGLLALAFLGAGFMKLTQPKVQLAAKGLGWTEDYSAGAVKAIGALELLAGIGLVLPALLDIAPVFVPLAALGLGLIMVGAIVVHARRKETKALPINVIFLVLAAVVVWGRFGPYAF
ncbi:DoxX family protein [Hamadaea sp. NPDC050747]|uniref:DoxX family protein n=1 Tax=Hamadaea sp. NPDC050747 TaxID=3155789 RepID=UPI0033DFF257